jgi:hypothetical protein
MVVALVAGAREAAQLSGMALGRGRRQRPQRAVALAGQCTAPHTTLMARALAWVDVRGRQLTVSAQQRQEWRDPLAPQREPLARLSGANAITACARLAERSLAMTHVGSAARLAAWAGVAPGHNTRAGQHHQGAPAGVLGSCGACWGRGLGQHASPRGVWAGRCVGGRHAWVASKPRWQWRLSSGGSSPLLSWI